METPTQNQKTTKAIAKANWAGFILSVAALLISLVCILIIFLNTKSIPIQDIHRLIFMTASFTFTLGAAGLIACIINLEKIIRTDRPKWIQIVGILCFSILLFIPTSVKPLEDKAIEEQIEAVFQNAIYSIQNSSSDGSSYSSYDDTSSNY